MMKATLLAALAAFTSLVSAQGQPPLDASGISTEAWYAVPDARGVQVVHIECGPNFLDPREIVVEPGRPVEFSVRSSEPSEEFVSGVAANVLLGKQPKKIAFTPGQRGRSQIFCRKQGTPDKDVHPRKKGLVHVGHPFNRP